MIPFLLLYSGLDERHSLSELGNGLFFDRLGSEENICRLEYAALYIIHQGAITTQFQR